MRILTPHQISQADFVNRMIQESGLKIISFDGLDEAAEQAVQLAH